MAGILTTAGFRDSRGNVGHVRFRVAAGTPANEATQAGAIVTAISAMTNAQLETSHGAFNLPPVNVIYGARGTYESIEDKAVLSFTTAVASFHRMQIPAPLLTVFLGDGETVDPAGVGLLALVAAMIGIATDANGNPLTVFVGGVRIRRKLRRRLSIYSLTPIFGPEE